MTGSRTQKHEFRLLGFRTGERVISSHVSVSQDRKYVSNSPKRLMISYGHWFLAQLSHVSPAPNENRDESLIPQSIHKH